VGERSMLLVVSHSRSGGTQRLVDAVVAGATSDEIEDVDVRSLHAIDAGVDDVEAAGAVIIGTPERFGAVSGLVKDFLERIYHPLLGTSGGKPYALVVKASTDGTGAIRDVERILKGLEWRAVRPPLLVVGDIGDEHLDAASELGMELAASLELGLF
jgi:multimeric flavodoxin WrbA